MCDLIFYIFIFRFEEKNKVCPEENTIPPPPNKSTGRPLTYHIRELESAECPAI